MSDPGLGPGLGEGIQPLTKEQAKQRRGRSIATALALVFLAFLFAAVTYVRLGDTMLKRHKPATEGTGTEKSEAPKRRSRYGYVERTDKVLIGGLRTGFR